MKRSQGSINTVTQNLTFSPKLDILPAAAHLAGAFWCPQRVQLDCSMLGMKLDYIGTTIVLLNISYDFKANFLLHMESPGRIYKFGTET